MTLTAIGIGTAFGLLLLMMVLVGVVRLLVKHVLERPEAVSGPASLGPATSSDGERSDKALAAIAAVTVLLSRSGARP